MREVAEKVRSVESVTGLVRLVKIGDRPSLSLLRERLGCSRAELAAHIPVPEPRLAAWEEDRESLSAGQLAIWRVKISDYLNLELKAVLHSDSEDLLACFWDLLWRLS